MVLPQPLPLPSSQVTIFSVVKDLQHLDRRFLKWDILKLMCSLQVERAISNGSLLPSIFHLGGETSTKSLNVPKTSSTALALLNPMTNAGSVPDIAQMPPRRRHRSVAGIDQDDLLDPDALADPDSSFYEINGVRVHHKFCTHEDSSDQSADSAITNADQNQIGLPIVLLHGFGSSVFSWTHIMRPLARIAGAKVLAFDRPAFGLTSRTIWSGDDTKPINPYSMAFSVIATLAFIDQLGAKKAVLVGYGCNTTCVILYFNLCALLFV
jgi:hypothetical protein